MSESVPPAHGSPGWTGHVRSPYVAVGVEVLAGMQGGAYSEPLARAEEPDPPLGPQLPNLSDSLSSQLASSSGRGP
ncbi:unnamed protein product [Rangifer tarandus platyrhynchus]|uniref:Uncharacterized protein n=1 Tax=Rangifer tarandus platyrhynchus TaxID=3082113 RepID=A0AC60A9T1_RANTA